MKISTRPFTPIIQLRHASTTAMNPARDSQTLLLPDGRTLGYAEYGHPNGYPLLFFHGFPASRLEAQYADSIARRHRLRLISVDRPGFGLSTFQPRRRITDWPADIQALAHHIRIPRFAILGGSGGGPYALACARALPRETMSAVGILAGAPPWTAGTKDLLWSARFTAFAANYCPSVLRVVTDTLVGTVRLLVGIGPVERWIEGWCDRLGKEEKRKREEKRMEEEQRPLLVEVEPEPELSPAEQRKKLLRFAFEGFAQGSRGGVQEAQLLTQDWGFAFEDIPYEGIKIWHGTKDVNAPISMIRYMAKRLPNSEFVEYEGENHFAVGKHIEEVLVAMIPEELKDNTSTKED